MTFPHEDTGQHEVFEREFQEEERTELWREAIAYVKQLAEKRGLKLSDLEPHLMDGPRDRALRDYTSAYTIDGVKSALRRWMDWMKRRIEDQGGGSTPAPSVPTVDRRPEPLVLVPCPSPEESEDQ